MIKCPKCTSYHINGPTYHKGPFGQENLVYKCMQCGYSRCERTADSETIISAGLGARLPDCAACGKQPHDDCTNPACAFREPRTAAGSLD